MDGPKIAPPPFLTKTYEMVDDPMTKSLVCWSETGCSFIVLNPPEFSRDLLPRYFKHNNFSSFVRQLNTYGFRKIDPEQWEFANEEFIRGQKHLLKNIRRRKPIHSHSLNHQGNSSTPLTDIEKREFEEEIKRLSNEKSRLQLHLKMHQKENQEFRFQISSLSQRFRNMEDRQRQVMLSLAQLIDKPHFLSMFELQSDIHNKKRKLLNSNDLNDEFNGEEHHSLISQIAKLGKSSASIFNLEQIEELESSIKYWETLLYGIGENRGEEVYDFGISSRPSPIVAEMQTSSGDYDVDGERCSPSSHLSSPSSSDINSSPELAMSVYHADNTLSSFHHIVNFKPESSGFGENPKHASHPKTEQALQQQVEEAAIDHSMPGKVNDVFWEQFLTEAPVTSYAQEIQSNPRSTIGRLSDSKGPNDQNYWWKQEQCRMPHRAHGTPLSN